ncbi:methyltransferase-like protein 22 [Triplophysa dalaica]|uniref:methyltransferase-like protein 22 n=1 Tax=Triplophysa dalaica TaxID=1582913 RepID=UPI0024DFE63D|nr:methyltransferase-like protein 22 [Triplophysa dalaica]XP_056609924.1 methyltransferase-like protein 22 [Triplophysa dalaica]XP_056609925.1 methyltransferase-like protein 22 [Triplophysa dalaica]XP_056609926.1 methyltransferase-like protein 22 [Triplophysa dalaica]XP_056609927.1 methyltransferase-like protein 22 [Triplophysa dalaica]
MDEVTFKSDTVLSDVHLLLPNSSHLMKRLNGVGQPVFISKFRILQNCDEKDSSVDSPVHEHESEGAVFSDLPRDEDGDLDVLRRPRNGTCHRDAVCPVILSQSSTTLSEQDEDSEEGDDVSDIIRIEHTMATHLEDVGKQVWRGAFLLADFILSQVNLFKGATVLELGAGTGLSSIVMAMAAKTVYCTDVGVDLLNMCQRNVNLNKQHFEPQESEIRVRQLDWLADDFCTDPDSEFCWTEAEKADLHDNTAFVIAADVCYDDDLTDGLFKTLYRITSNLKCPSITYLSLEKRLNFTLRHMDVSCEAYDHFRHCLDQLEQMTDGKNKFTVEAVKSSFPQFFQYERVELLELWKVTAERL